MGCSEARRSLGNEAADSNFDCPAVSTSSLHSSNDTWTGMHRDAASQSHVCWCFVSCELHAKCTEFSFVVEFAARDSLFSACNGTTTAETSSLGCCASDSVDIHIYDVSAVSCRCIADDTILPLVSLPVIHLF